jgi:cbb3-type cytochrome oxidase maturation protein
MMVMVLLLSVSLFVALLFLLAFIWSARNGQFEDRFAAANKILFENKQPKNK